jgi:sporulation protein YlmC with PRC-barrel domain
MSGSGGYGCRRAFGFDSLSGGIGNEGLAPAPSNSVSIASNGHDRTAGTSISSMTQGTNMSTNYVTRDNFGMYANKNEGPGPELMGANTLLGNDVYNKDGQDLGDIKEFMIDMASGKIAYAVLSFGGLLGMGEKLFAVPWAALTLDTVNERFTLNVPKDALKDAPGFNKDRWPTMSDKTWAAGVHKFYGMPYSAD